ncbi:serine/threonine protein kinase [Actinoplanes sp. SE50]|uniref:Stk1 family PASTA domain-containing Ser/Thr kinase n=1 Tax=unclassified Actinoplanes TaxID=2626549 RepID=UPI00023ECF8F|nr:MULTISPECIES: Stk1 family PASTA domain-containing Ser/Thr kinase [unclassified Actinoplanes]AEV81065.1 serine/threonine protein kinase, bacterial [Actinoplanes sp. SE50/110]ATO79466.1 serine/threonine protein kinase [Actinoplanes sp. SE50]SLL96866.1 serine/threonine protein kinase [Actinoplanes sp. SE50/110]
MTAQARLLGGRYQVGELLGYGGMAEVHRGRDLRLGRDVAIKMLRTDLARDATFQERFRREAQNSAALNHPAIVAVYDTGEEISATGEKLPFIVMEFVNGRTLKEVLAQEQRLQPRRALEIIADICAALEFSHRHGIIHRDIKPGNVMITQNGQVKVMDFGIARALASGATTMTQTSAVIGTAQYLSPEQARGEAVDARSDVYAAGCVLFELLVGHPPFVGDSPVSVAYQHVREDPRAPSSISRDIPPDVDAIVLKALAKNPLNRYQSAQEMRADALRAVSGRPVMATPVMNQAETVALNNGPRQWQPQAATTMQRPMPAAVAGGRPADNRQSWVWAALAGLGVLVVIVLGVALALNKTDKGGDQKPAAQAQVPDLKGLTAGQAQQKLSQLGFTNVTAGDPKEDKDCKGEVSDQTPPKGNTVPVTTQVTYTICNPPKSVQVPTGLVGGTKSSAEQALRNVGLVPKFKPVDSTSPKDQVVNVDQQGDSVPPGTEIVVSISNNELILVPDVVGRSQDAAMALLQNAGLNVTVETVNTGGDPGKVISQSRKPKSKAKAGDPISITVVSTDTPPSGDPSPDPTDTSGTGGGIGTNE